MDYIKPVVSKDELNINAEGDSALRSCTSFKCTSSDFNCGSYDCTSGGHKFTCNSGW